MKLSIFLLFVLSSLFSCKKDAEITSNSWNVKYEVTSSNPLTKAVILYVDKSGSLASAGVLGDVSNYEQLPWDYTAEYSKDPGLTIARTLVLNLLVANSSTDVITLKIYVNGNVVNQTTSATLTYMLIP